METRRSSMRILAPLALAVFGLAILLVIATSGGSDEGAGRNANAREEARDLGGKAEDEERSRRGEEDESSPEKEDVPAVYTVKEGDTLGGIAESTGVPVERLQELNPGLDQFSLVEGQKIKLR